MQARHLVHKLIPLCWQYEQACSVCTALFNHAISGIYEGFYEVVLDFIWLLYIIAILKPTLLMTTHLYDTVMSSYVLMLMMMM
jgi:hypothetical protein